MTIIKFLLSIAFLIIIVIFFTSCKSLDEQEHDFELELQQFERK